MRRWLRNNSLSAVLGVLFLACLIGQSVTGWLSHNQEESLHGNTQNSYLEYIASGDFHESVAENWESEFLQMGMFVLLTVFLFQKGSSESKDPDAKEDVDDDPRLIKHGRDVPWPVRRGGFVLWLYSHSLSLSLFALFGIAFVLHVIGGCEAFNDELRNHGAEPIGPLDYLRTARFWFESLENWQSEFLAILVMVVFSIYLREWGSPQSKPVAASHHSTGE